MSEIISQLALDATKVFSALDQLNVAFGKYNSTLQAVTGTASNFNAAEGRMGPAIEQVNQQLAAQAKFAQDAANSLRSVFTGRIDSSATLTEIKRVNDAFAALERTLTSTKATPTQLNNILGNLKGQFTGVDAQIQSALIAAKTATDQLGSSNAASTLKINQAAIKGKADALAKAEADALAAASQAASIKSTVQLGSQFSTNGASNQALNNYQASLLKFQDVAAKSGLNATQLNNVITNLGANFTGTQGKVAAAALEVQKFGGQLQTAQTQASSFGANIQSLVKIFTFQQALQALGALQQAFTASIGGAINFERQIAQIATISDAGDKNIDQLAIRVTNLANEFGKPAPETAAAYYQALSNQVGDASQSVQFLTEALKFSKSAVTDVSSAVDTLSAVQNAFGQTSASASHNADVLFRTIDLGRVTAKELGDSFGRILPIAGQLGISLEEVSAAISTATVQGVKFQDAQTQILNLLVAALKPTGALKQTMLDLGYASTEAGIAAEGFVGFFSKINQAAGGSNAELAKLFPNIRGLRGEISLFNDQGARLKDFLDQTTNSAEAAQKAFNIIQFSNAEQISNELNRIQNQLLQGFGRDAVAVLATLNNAFGGVADKVVLLGEVLAAALGTAVLATGINQIIGLLGTLSGALGVATTSAGLFGVAIAAVAATAYAAYKVLEPTDFATQFRQETEAATAAAAKFATDAANATRTANADIAKGLQEQVSTLEKGLAQQQAAINQAYISATTIESATTANFKSEVSNRLKAYNDFLNSIRDLQDKAATHAVDIANKQAQFTNSIQEARFNDRLSDTSSVSQKAVLLNQQINKLLGQSSASQSSGNTQFAETQIQQAKTLALEFEKITGNRTLTSKVEQAYTAFLAQQTAELQKQQQAAEGLLKTNTATVETARTQLDLALKLDQELQKVIKEPGGEGSPQAQALEQQIAAALDKAKAAEASLTTGLGKVGLSATGPQIQKAIDSLLKVTKGPDLQFTFQNGLATFRAEFDKALKANPLYVDIGINPQSIAKVQAQIVDLNKQIKSGLEKETALPGAQDALQKGLDALSNGFAKAKQQADDLAAKAKLSEVPGLGGFGTNVDNLKKIDEQNQKIKDGLDRINQEIKDVFADPTSFNQFGALTTDAAKKIDALLAPLRELADARAEAGASSFTKAFGDISAAIVDQTEKVTKLSKTYIDLKDQIEAGQAAQEKLNQINPDVQNGTSKGRLNPLDNTIDKNSIQSKQQLRDIEKELQQVDDVTSKSMQTNANNSVTSFEDVTQAVNILNESIVNTEVPTEQLAGLVSQVGQIGINAGEAAASGISIIGQEAEAQIGGVYALIDALAALAEAQAAAGGGGFASRGRYFAGGGQARGTDTIPAMLTKGEIVMNAGVSRQFFSQLMAMNAGVQPQFLSKGGQAGGTTFGDINVNVSNNGPGNIDARAIAQGIQRELRRGSIRSFTP